MRVPAKLVDSDRLSAKDCLRVLGRVTPLLEPDRLGRRPKRGGEFKKIRIRGYDCEAGLLGPVPNLGIGTFAEAKILNVP